MTLQERINYVKAAPNMVEVESVLNSITAEYLDRYAHEIEKAPQAKIYGAQSAWIENAIRFFIADIHRDKKTVWAHIPKRFEKTTIYQRLKLSQFVNYIAPVS